VKLKKPKKQSDKEAIAAISKEMAQPRFARSTRGKEEAAAYLLRNHKQY
jgi:hypothetical protein